MSVHLYHNFPSIQFSCFHLSLRQLHLGRVQEEEIWTDAMGRGDASSLLTMSWVEYPWFLSSLLGEGSSDLPIQQVESKNQSSLALPHPF